VRAAFGAQAGWLRAHPKDIMDRVAWPPGDWCGKLEAAGVTGGDDFVLCLKWCFSHSD